MLQAGEEKEKEREREREREINLEADEASALRPANRDDLEEVTGGRGCYGSSYAKRTETT